jgi:hypothetical protein
MANDSILKASLRLIVLIGLALVFGFFMATAMLWLALMTAALRLGLAAASIFRKARRVRSE